MKKEAHKTNLSESIFLIDKTEIILENKGENQGQIIINDNVYGAYQMYWGAMGGTIEDFLLRINSDYFADKLLGAMSTQVFDVKSTFSKLRKFIRKDIDLPWYKHLDFQKNLRDELNYFQKRCAEYNSEIYFVDHFSDYLDRRIKFFLIDDIWERERIEKDFYNISEPWQFIETKESSTTKWLKSLHNKIKRNIKSKTNTQPTNPCTQTLTSTKCTTGQSARRCQLASAPCSNHG